MIEVFIQKIGKLKSAFCYRVELLARKIQRLCIDKKTWEEVEKSYEIRSIKSEKFTVLEKNKEHIKRSIDELKSDAKYYKQSYEEALTVILYSVEIANKIDSKSAVDELKKYLKRLEQ